MVATVTTQPLCERKYTESQIMKIRRITTITTTEAIKMTITATIYNITVTILKITKIARTKTTKTENCPKTIP